jgi:NAD(P)-dependent dehydrogenase (short-subunit alcohol dehydrogenase family)
MRQRPVCLVTGAARRLGREIALELAANGYDIAVHYRDSHADAMDTTKAICTLGARGESFRADLSDEAACRELLGTVVARFARVDAVVNNASTFDADDPITFTHAAMERHWRANTAPAILLAQALHAHVRERGATGCVVNLIDQKLWNPNPDYFSYTLSKAALQAASVMLAQALAPDLRVCGIAPGVTLPSGAMNEAQFQAAGRMTPLRRSSTPQDVARAVRFLIESPAITGTTLLVDAGQHLVPQSRDVFFLAQGI